MRTYIYKVILVLTILQIPNFLFGQSPYGRSTGKFYIKTAHQSSIGSIQNSTKLNTNTYSIPQDELSRINPNDILYSCPIWQSAEGKEQYTIDNSIILYDVSELSSLILSSNLTSNILSIDSIAGEPTIYILSLGNMSYVQIDSLCETLSTMSYCKIAEPNYIIFDQQEDAINPYSNPLYTNQWGLNNDTLFGGVDINAPEAWGMSTGGSTKVAIIDCGFELTHPDLADNIYSSYDCTNGADGALYGAYLCNADSHGTQCAGVVGAVDNNIGIIGVAPDSKLILIRTKYSIVSWDPISLCYDTITISQNAWDIQSIRTAYQSGADVISISWHYGSLRPDTLTVLNAVMEEAYTQGRGGKGCVIVCSSGNDGHNFINYPSISPYTISVGATNRYGFRPTWSNFGDNLDLVAPGELIYTTQIVPYGSYANISGTSMAAPMVAGVAALVLSVNPYLTNMEVAEILKSSAYKLPGYDFDTLATYGEWNNEVGYGLVDAYAAVREAINRTLQGPDYVCENDTVTYQLQNTPADAVSLAWEASAGSIYMGNLQIVQGQGTSTIRVVLKRNQVIPRGGGNPHLNRDPYVKVTITKADNTTYTVTKNLRSPQGRTPIIEVDPSTGPWLSGTTRYFTITNNTNSPDSCLEWKIVFKILGVNDSTITYNYGHSIHYTPTIPPRRLGAVTITATNTYEACEEQSTSLFFGVSNSSLLSTYVNNGQLFINISDDNESQQRSSLYQDNEGIGVLELWHNIYGLMQTKQVQSTNEQMNISSLPQGVYILLLKENGIVIAETKVQIQ